MELGEKIAAARNKQGITQQQLAEKTNLTARTIQRIENGQSLPRAFTLTAIAKALDTTFPALQSDHAAETARSSPTIKAADTHFLHLLTLSCFSYLLIPFIHFLLPLYLLKKSPNTAEKTLHLARAILRTQIIWTAATNGTMLAALGFNFISAIYFNKSVLISYLSLFFLMYAINAILLIRTFLRINHLSR